MAKNGNWSQTLLRVVLGIIFTYHGYMKLFAPGAFSGTVKFFEAIGMPVPKFSALLAAGVEFFGGILLILGAVTMLATVALLIEMLVAFFKVHLANGFFISMQAYGYEFVLVLIAALVVVMANGAGKLSLGKMFKNKWLQ